MDFGKAFTFVFDDKDWLQKTGLVALCQLIPVIGQFIAMGFSIEIMRRIIANDPVHLPEFDFGDFLGKGFQAFVIGLVYSIPIFIFMIPIWISSASMSGMENASGSDVAAAVVSVICGGLVVIYSIVLAFIIPAAYGRCAASGRIGPALQVGQVFAMVTRAFVPFLIAVAGSLLVSLIAPLGAIACGVGALATLTYYYAVSGHLYAQAYRQAVPV